MHYTCEISINRPVAEVVAAFENPDNLKLWMDGLQHFEHISGEVGTEGAKTLL
ncbi:SRPBCC family protein [Flavobacterium litorale]|uniref:SRPBCC family protein n=1 Tax=Flavobacterium litorale TaxID=2856519 RepID=UPI002103BFBE|nr:SRPBCC family protein [Flavobacterium litorale]